MRLDNLPVEILRTCLGYLDTVDEHGRDHIAQTNRTLREVAVDSFAHHQRLSMRFPAYATKPSNSILPPKLGETDAEQVALASRRAWAFHSAKERLEHFFAPEQLQQRTRRTVLNALIATLSDQVRVRSSPIVRPRALMPTLRTTDWMDTERERGITIRGISRE